ncbi:peptidase M56 BlaR1 [Alkalicoccobacillus porphyridii]|uniref:Peptidase M56 BlaR1 n=1 Tax=Alkalicoccobacillus porphyridii TaxID=2597270 RepID=A0A554A0R7_9BACI|nr:peptidase M56 BlaR1 [Alkalicoccobacillus porphyridii]TSB47289.1 peptidase M56 BlaR1 [Alkalicoccobacillus porphyridii]
MIKQSLKISVIVATFLIGVLVGVFSIQTAFGGGLEENDYPKNGAGETYGSALFVESSEEEPDLISAIGTNGTNGYVKKIDLDEVTGEADKPKSPVEALKKQEERERNQDIEIPLYKEDGKTIIGKFEIYIGTE